MPKQLRKPKAHFSAKRDQFGNLYDSVLNPKPDYRVRKDRDIDLA